MEIKIDEKRILTEVLEMDGNIHTKIKEEVKRRLVDDLVSQIENTYNKSIWSRITEDIKDEVLEEIREKQEEIVKKILEDFYDSYRYGKTDAQMLQKLKEFISGEVKRKKD